MIYPVVLYSQSHNIVSETQSIESTRVGFSETYFEYKLDKYFRGLVFKNLAIVDSSRRFPYEPDYVLMIPDKNLYVDIEIDEPYTMYFGNYLPIHTIGKDDKRNSYFLDKGWDVIRFTEEQIALYPNACCKFISEHIYHRTGEHIWVESFATVSNLPQSNMMEAGQALALASSDFRNTYRSWIALPAKGTVHLNMVIDGIFLNQQFNNCFSFYSDYYPDKKLIKPASLKKYLTVLSAYFSNFSSPGSGPKDVNVYIFISTYHSFHGFDISEDYIETSRYHIHIFFIRTDQIICFEIYDYVLDRTGMNILFVGDDPAYTGLMQKWEESEKKVVVGCKPRNMILPDSFKYLSPDQALGHALGLTPGEV